jgi:hypothetical protein
MSKPPDPPPLPAEDERILELERDQLLQDLNLNGPHLTWRDDPVRRRRAAKPPYGPPLPRPPFEVGQYNPPREPDASHESRESYEAKWTARTKDPAVIDKIGVEETKQFAVKRADQIFDVWWPRWRTAIVMLISQSGSAGEYEWATNFVLVEEKTVARVLSEARNIIWPSRLDWYIRVCEPQVRKALESVITTWRAKLRAEELQLRKAWPQTAAALRQLQLQRSVPGSNPDAFAKLVSHTAVPLQLGIPSRPLMEVAPAIETPAIETPAVSAPPISSPLPDPPAASSSTTAAPAPPSRESFIRPILDKKGWSTNTWALYAKVDFHTADDYLKDITKPNKSTRKSLADALGIDIKELPD